MSENITHRWEIPDAPLYVVGNDNFFSGWGLSNNRINTFILPCKDLAEANYVADYARSRAESRYVRIVGNKPRLNLNTHTYSLLLRSDASRWYPKGEDDARS